MMIEQEVPELLDRQVQLAEGCPDFPRRPTTAVEQPSAVSRASPAEMIRCITMSFMAPAMRSRSCARRRSLPPGRLPSRAQIQRRS